VVRFDATTLWHVDAAEWAPSTASNSAVSRFLRHVCFTLETGHRLARLVRPKSADTVAKVCEEHLASKNAQQSNPNELIFESTLRIDA
jgi:hypothetical protein